MSTAPFPGAYHPAHGDVPPQHLASIDTAPIRRRANIEQAQAIEKLGHAIDHLTYSHMFLTDEPAIKADAEAIRILMRLKRSVFEECQAIVPTNRHLRRWIMEKLGRRSN